MDGGFHNDDDVADCIQDVTSTLNWNLDVFQAIRAAEVMFWDLFASD